MINVAVIDYNAGNIANIVNALNAKGASVSVLSEPDDKAFKCSHWVLPGVGAFPEGIEALQKNNWPEAIKEHIKTGNPLLGICLGMQLLLTDSTEFYTSNGLNIIPGHVTKIPNRDLEGNKLVVPHTGWNSISLSNTIRKNKILNDNLNNKDFYFVHSYHAVTDNPEHTTALCYYGGNKLSASIQYNNVYGLQFHPEKSAENGLSIIKNFIDL